MFTYDPELKKLTVRDVEEFPQEVFNYADTIEILDMSNNQLRSLPSNLSDIKSLRVAFFSENKFTEIPAALATCESLEMIGLKSCGLETIGDHAFPPTLRGLILTGNNLTKLPDSIGEYKLLQKLMLTGNQLSSLPKTLGSLKQLELIRIANNQLHEAPAWLSDLPHLSWYADSDNEFNPTDSLGYSKVRQFKWSEITLGVKLGESAKNTVYAATLQNGDQVAIKIFGQGTTTDGSPENDIYAALLAGDHPNIIGGLGRLVGAPNGEQGLVMPIISEDYKVIGLPPDFIALTRDSYSQGTGFSLSVVINIARDIGNSLQHLHSKGVMHGDVYAHNILHSADSKSKLGDFGAASIYNRNSPAEVWREKLDVAAYGHLIEELQRLTITEKIDPDTTGKLSDLSKACLSDYKSDRPTFAQINKIVGNFRI